MRRATRRRVRAAVVYAALTVVTAVTCFPLFWAALTSVRPNDEMLSVRLIPGHVTGEHYGALLGGRRMYFESGSGYRPTSAPAQHFLAWFANSVIVSVSTTVLSVGVSTLAAYSLTRFPFPGRESVARLILCTYMFAPIMIVIPFYILMRKAGLANSHLGLILAYTTFCLPFCMWMLRSFFQSIPLELEEAATNSRRCRWVSRISTNPRSPTGAW